MFLSLIRFLPCNVFTACNDMIESLFTDLLSDDDKYYICILTLKSENQCQGFANRLSPDQAGKTKYLNQTEHLLICKPF